MVRTNLVKTAFRRENSEVSGGGGEAVGDSVLIGATHLS